MGPKQRREREKGEMKQRILEAARELFVEHGYEAVSMRKIAERIEYSPTAIYLYFADKEALLHELCSTDFLAFAGEFIHLAKMRDPIERMRAAGKAYVDFALGHPQQYRFLFMTVLPEQSPNEEDRARLGNPNQDAYAFLRGTLAQAIDEGRLKPEYTDPDTLAQVAWSGMHGVLSLAIAGRLSGEWIAARDPRVTAETVMDLYMRGISKEA